MLRGAPREVISKPEIKEKAFNMRSCRLHNDCHKIENFTPQMKIISMLLTICPSIHPSIHPWIHPWIHPSIIHPYMDPSMDLSIHRLLETAGLAGYSRPLFPG